MAISGLSGVSGNSGLSTSPGVSLFLGISGNPVTKQFNFLSGALPSDIVFTRASTGWYFNSSGNLVSAANNIPRFDYGTPGSTTLRGLLLEADSSTNGIRNNTMQGVVAGTPGTPPTNWTATTNGNGLSTQIVGSGTSNGINYVDVRFFGTTSSTAGNQILFEPNNSIAAANAQTWTSSCYISIVGGSTANITTALLAFAQYSNVPAFLSALSGTTFTGSLTANLQRFTFSTVTNNASTAFIQPYILINTTGSAQAIDISLRVGVPQAEQLPFATSPILTTNAAVTRAADLGTVSSIPWFNATTGTIVVNFILEGETATSGRVYNFDDGTINNAIENFTANNPSTAGQLVVSGGANGSTGVVVVNNTLIKTGLQYLSASNNFYVNGVKPTLGAFGASTIPAGITQLLFGNRTDGNRPFSGWLQNFKYYNYAMGDSQLKAQTV